MHFDRLRAQHPFWPVTLVSGLMATLSLFYLLGGYWIIKDWRYLSLAGLAGLILLAHTLGRRLAGKLGRFDYGIWLITAVQILTAVLAPLWMADYWLVGVFLLATVPIEIGVADHVKRMPLFIFFSLLGAAAMVALDLLDLTGRVTVFSDLPGAVWLILVFFVLQVGGLTYLLLRLRVRPGARFYTRLDLTTQQTLVFTGISAAAILLVTGVLIAQIRASQIDQVGQNFQALAKINAERVGNRLQATVNDLVALGRREAAIQDGLAISNAKYPASHSDALIVMKEFDRRWREAPENSPFILSHRSNPQTAALSRFRGGDLLHSNVFLTDRMGGLVAAQGEKPDRYYFAELPWWQAAWNDGLGGAYLGDLNLDAESGTMTVFIAVGVLNPQTNRLMGVLASTYQLSAIQRDLAASRVQVSGEVRLINADRIVIAGPSQAEIGKPAPFGLTATGVLNSSTGQQPGELTGTDLQGERVVIAHAPLDTTSGLDLESFRALGWQILVSDRQADALAGVTRSTKIAGLAGLLVMTLVVMAAIATARVIGRPIEALTSAAAGFTRGDLEQRIKPDGPIEMFTLAEAFNSLAARLRDLINNLQDQVRLRTAQLEARANQLAVLNRITQEVVTVHDLQSALEIVAREMVQLLNARTGSIALLEAGRQELAIVADYTQDATQDSLAGLHLRIPEGSQTALLIETGRSIIVTNAQSNPSSDPLQFYLQNRGSQCFMVVPLLARGEVIGTIAMASSTYGREFSRTEVELAETIAGQIAGAIENARLFTEMEKAKVAAEVANQTKSTFLASISHELRTPLTSVLGFAKLIQKRLDERILPAVIIEDRRTQRAVEQVQENIAIIVAEGERLTTLINNVLDLAKIEAGKIEWQMQPLSIMEIVERAAAATASLFEAKGLALMREIDPDLPEVTGDRDRLIQVVINLLSNAVKFTPLGSVTCQARADAGEVRVSIIDTGIGIAAVDQPRVFEKFMQVGNTLTDKPQGTGLGLSICREIIEAHDGRIWVDSILGEGSTFSFALPRRPMENAPEGMPVGQSTGLE